MSPATEPRQGMDDPEPLVVLLARALGRYRRAIRAALDAGQMRDLPRSASWVVGSLAAGARTPGELSRTLGVTPQGLSRLSDQLVERGYIRRSPDAGDRRRVLLSLTDRGREASSLIAAAVAEVDVGFEARIGRARLAALRTELAALNKRAEDSPTARGR